MFPKNIYLAFANAPHLTFNIQSQLSRPVSRALPSVRLRGRGEPPAQGPPAGNTLINVHGLYSFSVIYVHRSCVYLYFYSQSR